MPSLQDTIRIHLGPAPVGVVHHLPDIIRGRLQRNPYKINMNERKCFIFGMANYTNIGDLAIGLAEIEFLHRTFGDNIIPIDTGQLWANLASVKRYIRLDDVICINGGGNMGGKYSAFELERCAVISLFPGNTIIVMPQTIHYSPSDGDLLHLTQKTYAKHRRLHLFARERHSLETMQEYYPTTTVSLAPDIALSLDVSRRLNQHPQRSGVLLALRDDKEKALTADDANAIVKAITNHGKTYSFTDTIAAGDYIPPQDREALVINKIREFQCAELIITDRLHGMVFAALAGTPCIAFNNTDHKVQGVYEWLSSLPYITFVENPSGVSSDIAAALGHHSKTYDHDAMLPYYHNLEMALSQQV